MKSTITPLILWDYYWKYICDISSWVVTDLSLLEGISPYEWVHKYTPGIVEYAGFRWYQWVYYHNKNFPNNEGLGRWLDPTIGADKGIYTSYLQIRAR